MGNFGFAEMLVIAVIALLVFGPDRLPELARNAGRAMSRFRAETTKSIDELKRAASVQGIDEDLRSIRRDMDGIRSSVTGALSGAAATATGTAEPRAEDRPPPTDPEAT